MWKLYNAKDDPSELHDLGKREPKLCAEMVADIGNYSEIMGIIGGPVDFNPVKVITGSKQPLVVRVTGSVSMK